MQMPLAGGRQLFSMFVAPAASMTRRLVFTVLMLLGVAVHAAEHPYLLLTPKQVPAHRARVEVPGSLNQKYFDAIEVCPDSVPAPAAGWAPPMADFRGTPHARVLDEARRNLIAAGHSALKYLLDPARHDAHGAAAKACVVDLVAKWDPVGIIEQYRNKADGNADEHEAAQFAIYTALVYDMACSKFSTDERQKTRDWLALAAVTLGTSETDIESEFEPYPRQNHPASAVIASGVGALALKDEIPLLRDAGVAKRLHYYLERTTANIPIHILDGDALADGRPWEGSAYGTYTLPFALLWGRMHNQAYGGNVFAGRGIAHVLEWYAHSRAAAAPSQLVEYGDDYDRYGAFAEMLILFESGDLNGYDKWLLDYLHPGGDMFEGEFKTRQAYTDPYLNYVLFYPQELKPVPPEAVGKRPTKYFRDFRDRSGGEVHFKNRFMDTPDGDDTVQLVLYSHRDVIGKGGLGQGSLRFYAYGEKFTEEEARRDYAERPAWASMKHFTTFDYYNPDCPHDGSLPRYPFYAQRDNPGLGRVEGFIAGDFADYARADGRFPLGDPSLNAAWRYRPFQRYKLADSVSDVPGDPHYVEPVERADRLVMLLKDAATGANATATSVHPCFIIVDDYQIDAAAHTFRWRWHAPRQGQTSLGDYVIDGQGTGATPFRVYRGDGARTNLEITFLAPDGLTSEISTYAPGGQVQHQMLEVKEDDVAPVFLSVLFPRKQGFERPEISALAVDGQGGAGGSLQWTGGVRDRVVYGRAGRVSGGGVEAEARLSIVRTVGGRIVAYAMGEGKQLSCDGQRLVDAVADSGSVTCDGVELVLAAGIHSGHFFGPGITKVTVDGNPASFIRDGDFVCLGSAPGETTVPDQM